MPKKLTDAELTAFQLTPVPKAHCDHWTYHSTWAYFSSYMVLLLAKHGLSGMNGDTWVEAKFPWMPGFIVCPKTKFFMTSHVFKSWYKVGGYKQTSRRSMDIAAHSSIKSPRENMKNSICPSTSTLIHG